jgi:hypothetical protein
VVEDIPAAAGGLNEEFEAFADFVLADVVAEAGGTEADIEGLIDFYKFIPGGRGIHTHVLAVGRARGNIFCFLLRVELL